MSNPSTYTPPVQLDDMSEQKTDPSQTYAAGTMVTPPEGTTMVPQYDSIPQGQPMDQVYIQQGQQPQQQYLAPQPQQSFQTQEMSQKGCCISCLGVCCKIVGVIIALVLLVAAGTLIVLDGSPYVMEYTKMESTSPMVTSGKFDNGFQYTILKNGYKKGKFVTYLCVDAGSVDEDDAQLGIAHFFEHCAFDNTRDYKGRNGLIWALLKTGAIFNAFTTWRSTCYQIWDMPSSKENLEVALNFHVNQVLYPELVDANLSVEKGAVEGEDRFRNSSASIALDYMLKNHGGPGWRIPKRFPIGKPSEMVYDAANTGRFHKKWYRIDRMRLYTAGDYDVKDMVKAVENKFKSQGLLDGQDKTPPAHESFGEIKPVNKFQLQKVDGIDGVQLSMLITANYSDHPYNYNHFRRMANNQIFATVYVLQVLARLQTQYKGVTIQELAKHITSAGVLPMYQMNTTLILAQTSSPGPAQQSAWRRDFETGLTELRRIAVNGVDRSLLTVLAPALQAVAEVTYSHSGVVDNTIWANLMMGADGPSPKQVFMDPEQVKKMSAQFLNPGFARVISEDIKYIAQFLWSGYLQVAFGENFQESVWHDSPKVKVPQATLNVFVGADATPADLNTVTQKAIFDVIRKVHNDTAPSSASLQDFISATTPTSGSTGATTPGEVLVKVAEKDLKDPSKGAKSDSSGIQQYTLANGIKVNFKNRTTGSAKAPNDAWGKALMQINSLGGASTLPASLKGACELLNANKFSGFDVYYAADNYTTYNIDAYNSVFSSMPTTMSCSSDYTSITVPLTAGCANKPDQTYCLEGVKYDQVFAAARLHFFPYFDTETLGEAAKVYKDAEETMVTQGEPMQIMEYYTARKAMEQFFGDHRFGYVSADDIAKVNAVEMTQWVREQFQPIDRVEINLVGTFTNEAAILKKLNQYFGSMPNIQSKKVGYDPYNATQVTNFQINWPANDSWKNCSLPNVTPNRGYVTMIAPGVDFLSHRDDQYFELEKMLFNFAMFKTVRIINGYGYFAVTRVVHSVNFKDVGAYVVIWAPGNYPQPKPGDPVNIQASQAAVKNALRNNPIDKQVFDNISPFAQQYPKGTIQGTEAWLAIMRGGALKSPASWPTDKPTVKDIGNMNIPDKVGDLTYANVQDIIRNAQSGKGMLTVSLDTIPIGENGGAGSCF